VHSEHYDSVIFPIQTWTHYGTFIVFTKKLLVHNLCHLHGCDAVNKDKCPDLLFQSDCLCQVVNVSVDIHVFIGFCMCNCDYVV